MKSSLFFAKIKAMLPFLAVIALAFYLLPSLLLLLRNHSDWGMPLFMLLLLLIDPVICLACSIVYGLKYSFNILCPIVVAILFLPAIFIFFNSTAWVYAVVYGVIALIGNAIGTVFYKRRNANVQGET
jgi:hypothetical protein